MARLHARGARTVARRVRTRQRRLFAEQQAPSRPDPSSAGNTGPSNNSSIPATSEHACNEQTGHPNSDGAGAGKGSNGGDGSSLATPGLAAPARLPASSRPRRAYAGQPIGAHIERDRHRRPALHTASPRLEALRGRHSHRDAPRQHARPLANRRRSSPATSRSTPAAARSPGHGQRHAQRLRGATKASAAQSWSPAAPAATSTPMAKLGSTARSTARPTRSSYRQPATLLLNRRSSTLSEQRAVRRAGHLGHHPALLSACPPAAHAAHVGRARRHAHPRAARPAAPRSASASHNHPRRPDVPAR